MKNIILFFFCFFATSLNAQTNDVANWTHHQFLDEVNDIAETENDMWFATNTGLVRMNKTSLEKTIYHPYNSPLPGQHIEAVTVNADGQIFIGIYDNIVARFDGDDDWDIIDVPVDDAILSANQMPLLFTIFIDDENEIWLGTNSGLLHYQADGTWEIFNDGTQGNTSISFQDVWDITQTDNGDLFISSFEIYKYDGTDFTNLSEGNNDLFSYGNTSIKSHGDEVWFSNQQVISARYVNETWTIYEAGEGTNGLPSGSISDLAIDEMGIPYVTYESANVGVHKFENDIWTAVTDEQVSGISQGLSSIYFTDNNDRWLTAKGDVFHSNSTTDTQIVLQESPLIDALPRLVKEASDGSVYCYSGTFFEGKLVKFTSPREWEEISFPAAFSNINDMDVTSTGGLVISTVQGIFQYENEIWTEVSSFPAAVPREIALDSEDGIWVTTATDGLYHYDGSLWTTYNAASSGLSSDFLNSISIDRNNGVWLVSEGQNLEYFDGDNWELFNESNSLLSGSSLGRDLYFDENNELWLPEFSGSILHYDGATWEDFVLEPFGDFLQYKITGDEEGTLYAATSLGIYQFDGANWQAFLNEENSLLLDNESKKLLITQDDFFWISTEEGLFVYDSEIISAINSPEILDQGLLTVYPNPTTDFIRLKMESSDNDLQTISIYDNTGRLLRSKKMNTSESINVIDLPIGVYYLKVNGKKANNFTKFIKK